MASKGIGSSSRGIVVKKVYKQSEHKLERLKTSCY